MTGYERTRLEKAADFLEIESLRYQLPAGAGIVIPDVDGRLQQRFSKFSSGRWTDSTAAEFLIGTMP